MKNFAKTICNMFDQSFPQQIEEMKSTPAVSNKSIEFSPKQQDVCNHLLEQHCFTPFVELATKLIEIMSSFGVSTPKYPNPTYPSPEHPSPKNTKSQNTQCPKYPGPKQKTQSPEIPKTEIAIPIKYLTSS